MWDGVKTYILAEIGCNHQGDIEIAKKMIDEAVKSGANCIKVQKRDIDSLNDYSASKIYDSPNSFGKTYTEHRAALELSLDEQKELAKYAKSLGTDFAASCWDKKSVDDMEGLVDFYKIQSADSHNFDLIEYVISKKKPVLISNGGTTYRQLKKVVDLANQKGVQIAIMHCTSLYPLDFDKVNLNNIVRLKELFPKLVIGYSGHERGISISTAAMALGAKIIERHFTLDRTWKGSDHAASLEPQGFAKLVRDIRHVEEAMGEKDKVIYEEELKKLDSLNSTRKPFYWEG